MPINLAGGYAAGGVRDALLDLVKQRMLEQELAQREEENQFQRLRAQRQDERAGREEARQIEQDKVATAAREEAARLARYHALENQPQDVINANLGTDQSTGKTVQAPPNPAVPGGMPSYLIGQNPQSNPMMVAGASIRPRSKEMQLEDAKREANAKAMNTGVSLSPGEVYGTPEAGVMMRGAPVVPKPVNRTALSGYQGPNGEPLQQDEEGRVYAGQQEIPLSQVRRAPSQAQPPQPQQWFDAQGKPHAIMFSGGKVQEIPLPEGLVGKTNPVTAQIRNREDFAKRVSSHIPGILDLMDQASDQGLLGPVAGRFSEFMAGKVGSTGNPDKDELLAQLRSEISFLKSGMGVVHSGARGAAVQMLARFDSILDSGKMSESELRGAIRGYQNWLNTYADDLGAEPTPKKTSGGEGDKKSVTAAELAQLAKAHGTTVEQERARATAEGFVIR